MRKKKDKHYDVYEIIAKNIKFYRKSKNMTQAQLAEKTEYSHEFIRRIESEEGKRGFSVETLWRIATVLERPIDDFLDESILKSGN